MMIGGASVVVGSTRMIGGRTIDGVTQRVMGTQSLIVVVAAGGCCWL